jgi:hypothetical protein
MHTQGIDKLLELELKSQLKIDLGGHQDRLEVVHSQIQQLLLLKQLVDRQRFHQAQAQNPTQLVNKLPYKLHNKHSRNWYLCKIILKLIKSSLHI